MVSVYSEVTGFWDVVIAVLCTLIFSMLMFFLGAIFIYQSFVLFKTGNVLLCVGDLIVGLVFVGIGLLAIYVLFKGD